MVRCLVMMQSRAFEHLFAMSLECTALGGGGEREDRQSSTLPNITLTGRSKMPSIWMSTSYSSSRPVTIKGPVCHIF